MVDGLYIAKPLHKPMLNHYQFDPQEYTSMNSKSNHNDFFPENT